MLKNKKNRFFKFVALAPLFYFAFLKQANAIPPPDFIVQIVSQAWVYIAMWFAILSTLWVTLLTYFKSFYSRYKKIIIVVIVIFICLFAYLSNLYYEKNKLLERNLTINKWLEFSDTELYDKYKDLSYDQKVDLLLKIAEKDLLNWLFDNNLPEVSSEYISDLELEDIINKGDDNYVLLDARDKIEYEIWHIPWSINYRVADLKIEEKRKELSPNKKYIVLCWTWMRWSSVSSFLLSKWINSIYLEGGLKNRTDKGYIFSWVTELKYAFKDSNYSNYMNSLDFLREVDNGVKIVDARDINRLKKEDLIQWANQMSMSYTSSKDIDKKLSIYSSDDKVIVVCDDYYNCFDWQLFWIELEKRGVDFLWIFIKKWIIK